MRKKNPTAAKGLLHIRAVAVIAAICVIPLLFSGCTDNPVDSEGWDHVPAVGYELEMEGDVLVSYFLRQYEFNPSGAFDDNVVINEDIVVGGKLVFANEQLEPETLLTPEITIHYLDENRNRIDIPQFYLDGERNPEGEWNLEFDYFEPGSRNVRLDPEDRPYEVIYDKTEESWKFRLKARHHGRADLRIILFHLDHSDMTPIPLPIKMDLE